MSSAPPFAPLAPKDGGSAAAPLRRSRTPKRILVVEDDELNMRVFHDLLGSQGFETIESRDGCTALEMARAHVPDLVVLDVQLPGMSGLELTRRLKADRNLSAVPIIAVTAFALKRDAQRVRDSGCDAYITKPFSIQTLLNVIDANIDHDADEDDELYDDLEVGPQADAARADGEAPPSVEPAELVLLEKHNGTHVEPEAPSEIDIPPVEGERSAPEEEPVREWTIAKSFDEPAEPKPDVVPTPATEEMQTRPVAEEPVAAPGSATEPTVETARAERTYGIWPGLLFVGWPALMFMGVLAAATLWPASYRGERTPNLYAVEFVDDVVDLSIGSPVRQLGTNVGKVARITVNPENQNRIQVVMELASDTPIKRDTTAILRHENLVGAAYVELSEGDPASPPLKTGPGQLIANIPVATSQTEPVVRDVSQLFARAALLVDAVAQVLDEDNARTLADSLDNMRAATEELAEASDKADGLIAESVSATVTLRETVQHIDALAGRFEREIAVSGGSGNGVSAEIGATVAELYRAASALNHAVANLDAIAIDNRKSLRELYARGIADGNALTSDIRALVSRLTTIVTAIEINGSSLPASGSTEDPDER